MISFGCHQSIHSMNFDLFLIFCMNQFFYSNFSLYFLNFWCCPFCFAWIIHSICINFNINYHFGLFIFQKYFFYHLFILFYHFFNTQNYLVFFRKAYDRQSAARETIKFGWKLNYFFCWIYFIYLFVNLTSWQMSFQ